MKSCFIIPAILTLAACTAAPCGWRVVGTTDDLRTGSLHSAGADGRPLECRAWMEGDTVAVLLSDLDLGWAYITLNIHDGRFRAQLDGVPFHTAERPTFETVSQRLWLAKESYALGDTLCARFDLRFRVAFPSEDKSQEYTFRGALCEVIRTKDFDPFAKENYLTFDLPTALHELGEPLDRRIFRPEGVSEFSIELFNHFPPGTEFVCEELTWDISPERAVSDGGKERLTIWYVRRGDRTCFRQDVHRAIPAIWNDTTTAPDVWLPLNHKKWNTDTQF